MEIPFLVENVSSYVEFKESTLSEWAFLTQVVEKADCGILLDINNIYVSARNHNFDPFTYLNHMPAERVIQYHIAGHDDRGSYILDSHDHPVRDDVWALYAHAVPLFGDVSLMLERDEEIPPLPELLAELDYARSIHAKAIKQPEAPALLTDLQQWMSKAIQSPKMDPTIQKDAQERLTASSTLSAEERLNIYLKDYWPRCLDSLRDDFPELLAHWGPSLFSQWMTAYLQKRPSQSFTLFHLPEGLAQFIDTTYHETDRERVQCLVAYEWAKNKAYFAKQEPVFQPSALTPQDQQKLPELPLVLQPHVSVVLSPHTADTYVVVYRQKNRVETYAIDAVFYRLLTCFTEAKPLSEAIDYVTQNSAESDIAVLAENTEAWFQIIVKKEWLIQPKNT